MKVITFFVLLSICVVSLWSVEDFNVIENWKHEFEALGRAVFSTLDKNGDLIVTFQITGNRLITPGKVIKFAPWGQGPSDLMNVNALFHYKNDIAFVERPEKVKIFTKKNDTYVWKQTIWLKRGKLLHIVANGIFCDKKWFIAGYEALKYGKEDEQDVSFLKIYDEEGNPLKNLICIHYNKPHQFYNMRRYVIQFKSHVFFLSENELKVHIISLKDLEVEKEVSLEIPEFYKKMPRDFYAWKKYDKPGENFKKDIEHWKTSYSRIIKVLVEDNFLVLQVRTCSDKLKNFSLLFYNAGNFKLEKTIFINDLLLGAKDGRYYCFANGDPGLDEEAEDFIINIYSFNKKNK